MINFFTKENWLDESTGDNTSRLLNLHNGLRIMVNYYPDKTVQFTIFDGDRTLGSGNTFAPTLEAWKENFVFNGGFNVFLSKQDVHFLSSSSWLNTCFLAQLLFRHNKHNLSQ